jgi:hypothetical protein
VVEGGVARLAPSLLIGEAEERERVGVGRAEGDAVLELPHVAGGIARGEALEQPAERALVGRGRRGRGPAQLNRRGAGAAEQERRGGGHGGQKRN